MENKDCKNDNNREIVYKIINTNNNTSVIIILSIIIILVVIILVCLIYFYIKNNRNIEKFNDDIIDIKKIIKDKNDVKENYLMYPESTEPTVPPNFYRYRHTPIELNLNENKDGYYINQNNPLTKLPLIKNPVFVDYDDSFDKSYFAARPFYYTEPKAIDEKFYPKFDKKNIATNNMPYLDVNKKTGQLNDFPFQLTQTSNGNIAPKQPMDKVLQSDLFNPKSDSIYNIQNTASLEYLKNNTISFGEPNIYKSNIGYLE